MTISQHLTALRKLLNELPTPRDPELSPGEALEAYEEEERLVMQGYAIEHQLDLDELRDAYTFALETIIF